MMREESTRVKLAGRQGPLGEDGSSTDVGGINLNNELFRNQVVVAQGVRQNNYLVHRKGTLEEVSCVSGATILLKFIMKHK